MTNNNWRGHFNGIWNYFWENKYETIKEMNKNLIEELLTKKDQEHKAELEMIKEEIEDLEYETIINPSSYNIGVDYAETGWNEGTAEALSILDSHINKQ